MIFGDLAAEESVVVAWRYQQRRPWRKHGGRSNCHRSGEGAKDAHQRCEMHGTKTPPYAPAQPIGQHDGDQYVHSC